MSSYSRFPGTASAASSYFVQLSRNFFLSIINSCATAAQLLTMSCIYPILIDSTQVQYSSTRGLRHLQKFSGNSGHACHVQRTASKIYFWKKLFLAIPEYDVLIFGHMNYMRVLKESTVRRTLDTYKNFRFWRVDRKHYIIAEICHVGLVSFVSRTMTHALFP
jgi:hypothetical protein